MLKASRDSLNAIWTSDTVFFTFKLVFKTLNGTLSRQGKVHPSFINICFLVKNRFDIQVCEKICGTSSLKNLLPSLFNDELEEKE